MCIRLGTVYTTLSNIDKQNLRKKVVARNAYSIPGEPIEHDS